MAEPIDYNARVTLLYRGADPREMSLASAIGAVMEMEAEERRSASIVGHGANPMNAAEIARIYNRDDFPHDVSVQE